MAQEAWPWAAEFMGDEIETDGDGPDGGECSGDGLEGAAKIGHKSPILG